MGPTQFVGSLGQALILMTAMAALGIFVPLWLCYASHCFLVVLTESSIGDAEVNWPDETVLEWWWKPLYCVGILAFWGTAGATVLSPLVLAGPWVYGIAGAVLLWYAYPIGILSVMDAHNALAVVHMPLILRLMRYAGPVLLVGLMTLPLGVATVGLLVAVMLRGMLWAIPTAFVLPIAVLLYARSWGRLAWMVLNVKARRRPDEPAPPEAAAVVAHDPWAMPAVEEIPELDVQIDEPAPPISVLPSPAIDEWDVNPAPYEVPPTETAEAPFSNDEYYRQYRKREEARKARAEGRKPGEKRRRASFGAAFGRDFWPFLFEHRTERVALSLGVLTLIVLALVRIVIEMLP